ncbi:hypothetical protein [Methanohalophilus portucalensis]|uniref:Uncharacterized protein n=1 Tax=Methanohalophilus portucalensis FDF-1 TaxID=523843 RepID=A0A1L9C2X2_9EURY|nr:hypothetical protein [Methanohalophilus portucalensis]OJH48813.1 hypothetical protein MPF_1661 [Methanohalophilus portucalensis FDF-1]SMH36878.1 hypothetical protein SAMN06264941_1101 [Methanohalophilus portucalensis FDF-1]
MWVINIFGFLHEKVYLIEGMLFEKDGDEFHKDEYANILNERNEIIALNNDLLVHSLW